MHKLRRAMVRPDRDRLGGPGTTVEMDSTFIGGRAPYWTVGRYSNKHEVVIAVERRLPRRLGRVRPTCLDMSQCKTGIFDFTRAN